MDEIDLFERPEEWSEELRKVIAEYEEECADGFTYAQAQEMLERCEAVGYTFEYGLDAQPFGLRRK